MNFDKPDGEQSHLFQLITKRVEDNEIHVNQSYKDALEEVITAIINDEPFGDESKLNAVMFKGLPGTGKGYTTQWLRTKVADVLGEEIPIVSVGSMQTPEDVMQLYNYGREVANEKGRCIIWDDEVDKHGKRGEGQDAAKEAVLNQFLIEMQGHESNKGLTTICCTNRPDKIDSAYRRGKRCGKEITFDPLDKEGREHLGKIEAFERDHQFIFNKEDVGYIVPKTYGAVGADMSQLFIDAATHTNLVLYRSLKDIARSIIKIEDPEKIDEKIYGGLIENLQDLGLSNLEHKPKVYLDNFISGCETFLADDSNKNIKEDDAHREDKLVERYARKMFVELNPNKKNDESDESSSNSLDDNGEKPETIRWINVNRNSIDHVLEHFVPSALKDMPFEETDLTFESLGGMDAQVAYLKRIVENTIIEDKEGTTVYLFGQEGCGVTSLARSVAGEYGFNLIVLYGADQESKWVGEVKDRLLEINDRAKASKPTILVFDNVHYLAQNTAGMDQTYKQTATSVLKQIIKPTKGVIYIATGQNVEQLDVSTRSLFKRHIEVDAPSKPEHYQKIWQSNLNPDYLPDDSIDFIELSENSTGLSGGDINNICLCFAELGVKYSQEKLGKVVEAYQKKAELQQGQRNPQGGMSDIELANLILS